MISKHCIKLIYFVVNFLLCLICESGRTVVSTGAATIKVKHAATNLPTLFYKRTFSIDTGRDWPENTKDCFRSSVFCVHRIGKIGKQR